MPHISDLPGKVVRQILIHLCESSDEDFDANSNYLLAANQGYLPPANGIKVEHEEYEDSIEFKWDGELPHWSGRKKIVKDDPVDQTTAAPSVNFNVMSNQSSPAQTSGGGPVQLHNEHNPYHLRKRCFPCFIAHRSCDGNKKSNSICSRCARQAKLFPNEFDPKVVCVRVETEAFKNFKAARADKDGNAKALADKD